MSNEETVLTVLSELTTQDLLEIHSHAANLVRERPVRGPEDITRLWVESVLIKLLNKADLGLIP